MSDVYAIVNEINGDRYVGSSVNSQRRYRSHVRMLATGKHHSQHLQRAWLKYGPECFSLRVLEFVADGVDLAPREQFHMSLGCRSALASRWGMR